MTKIKTNNVNNKQYANIDRKPVYLGKYLLFKTQTEVSISLLERKLNKKLELEEAYQSEHKQLKKIVYELESKIKSIRLLNTIFRVFAIIGLLIFLLKK